MGEAFCWNVFPLREPCAEGWPRQNHWEHSTKSRSCCVLHGWHSARIRHDCIHHSGLQALEARCHRRLSPSGCRRIPQSRRNWLCLKMQIRNKYSPFSFKVCILLYCYHFIVLWQLNLTLILWNCYKSEDFVGIILLGGRTIDLSAFKRIFMSLNFNNNIRKMFIVASDFCFFVM